MTAIKLAFIDLAGTSVRDNGLVERAVTAAISSVSEHVPAEALTRFRDERGRSKRDMFEVILGDSRLARTALRSFEDIVENEIATGAVTEIPGATQAFSRLRERGVKLALGTGFSDRIRRQLLEQLDWTDLVDISISPSQRVRGRPYPDMILTAMLRLRIDAVDQVAVVGDTFNDLLAGARAGARLVIGVLGGAHSRAELEQVAHTHILNSIAELPHLLV
jgi:phosphonatase-like hydrolase